MHTFKKNWKIYLGSAVILAVVFVAGMYAGYANRPWIDRVTGVSNKEPEVTTDVDFSPFWKVWNIINQDSIDPSVATDQDRVWSATEGLMNSLNDPYSVFFPPQDAANFNAQISGQFDGVGMEVGTKDSVLTVISPLKGSPAEKAGIKAGDQILKINGTTTADMTLDDAVDAMRGAKGTSVVLTIGRQGETAPLQITIVRDVIDIPTIDQTVLPGGIHVISLYSFDADSASLFQQQIEKFQQSGDNKLILDLRGNPGGYLDAAVDIASWFLPSNDVVVTEDYGAKQPPDVFNSKGYNIFGPNLKMAILVDGGSASASEILAGALSEHGVAKLIGTQTFGKGSVQEVVPVTDDTFVKITVAKWLTPDGISISEKGLTPDIVVNPGPNDTIGGTDAQLDRAVQYVNTGK